MSERVILTTTDHIKIIGDYYETPGANKFAILLHMMPATKESWKVFAEKLSKAGFSALAIDERGHGESTMDGTLDYRRFGDEEQQAKIHDVEAAFEFLKSKGASESVTILVGASIGANLTIQFLAEHSGVLSGVAMSPGLDYRGVKTDGFIRQLGPSQRIMLVASDDDDRDSAASTHELHSLNLAQTVLVEKTGAGHGTTMFERDPGLMDEVIEWLL
ncbi:MAG: Alpha/beta hydrolase fold protein [uncultured bacterium]|nr:MAG: Alpha/beta hydrolase fold protein [uncultured bacterium]HBD05697.1 hypothetical protein [Candidatus Uhrbacteria bacterium]